MSNFDKRLDEILDRYIGSAWLQQQHTTTEVPGYGLHIGEAKQAILRWVADEVIGEDDNVRLEHSDSAMTKKGERNWVRHEQRKILAQHGYKGD